VYVVGGHEKDNKSGLRYWGIDNYHYRDEVV
jgi:hypothetical protein